MDLTIAGRRALVTGPTSGIGFATAVGLAREGAHAVVNGRTRAGAADALVRLHGSALLASAEGFAADVSAEAGPASQQAVESAPEIAWTLRPPRGDIRGMRRDATDR
jgi:NAD(P)-dependent dehydrogenase (short-subunit alcohol dehydrogenase family)